MRLCGEMKSGWAGGKVFEQCILGVTLVFLYWSGLQQEGKDLKRNPVSLPSLLWLLKAKDEVWDEATVPAAYFLLWNPDQLTEHRAMSNASLPEIILVVLVPINVFNSVFEH